MTKDWYFGKEEYELYGDRVTEALVGKTIDKSIANGDNPGGVKYEAERLNMTVPELLGCLEGMCHNGKARETSDHEYLVFSKEQMADMIARLGDALDVRKQAEPDAIERHVFLDPESDKRLKALCERFNLTESEAIRRGIAALHSSVLCWTSGPQSKDLPCKVGEAVCAIVQNAGTFHLEVKCGIVTSVNPVHIEVTTDKTPLSADVHTFPTTEWGKSIFRNMGEADAALYIIEHPKR